MAASKLKVGDKLDIKIQQSLENQDEAETRTLKSVIYETGNDGTLEISMPTEGGKIILLAQGTFYELIFYTKTGMYRCVGMVRRRYKSEGLYMLTIEPKTELEKFQRREYYRHECTLDVNFFQLTEEEAGMQRPTDQYQHHRRFYPGEQLRTGVALDISGGGVRMATKEPVQVQSRILMNFHLSNAVVEQEIWIQGIVLRENVQEDSRKMTILRIAFITDDVELREQIIKYIFEEERKNRQNNRG